jgi:AraC-like DNA-binding protein
VSRRALHVARVFAAPVDGVYSTHIDSDRHFGRHWHDTFGFGVLERGAHASASGRGNVRAYEGDVITTNPGEVHDGRPLGGPTRRWRIACVDVAAMSQLTGQDAGQILIARPVISDDDLAASLRRLFRRLERWNAPDADGATALACEESLVETCSVLMSRHGTAATRLCVPDAALRRVRERLGDDVDGTPTLAVLAAMCGLSRYQVLRRFEKAYGLPPHAWLLRRRAERARALIQAGSPLATAAASSGFADQSHLSRVFVRQFGFTPGTWQKAARRKLAKS